MMGAKLDQPPADETFCELSVEKEGERFVVRDQDGRRVRGVRAVSVNQRMREVTTATVEFIVFKSGTPEAVK